MSKAQALPSVLGDKRIAIVVNKDWYFLSHRLPLAECLRAAGAEVIVVAGATGREREIERLGFEFKAVPFDRGGINPFRELGTVASLVRTYRVLNPDVVHHVAIKAYLYGSLAAFLARVPHSVSTIAGLGYLFTSGDRRARILRALLAPLQRLVRRLSKPWFLFFNPSDAEYFVSRGFAERQRTRVVPGSGVDTERFRPAEALPERPTIVFCSRILWDKGIGELCEALRILRGRNVPYRCVVAGEPDSSNPAGVPVAAVESWVEEGLFEWHGFVQTPELLLREASIAVLPSYREGAPLFLIEALASGVPVVTTDVPGCRDVVRHGENGMLVPPRSGTELAAALEELLSDQTRLREMGRAGRRLAEERFGRAAVDRLTLEAYRAMLGQTPSES